ncbi:hypothetical protein [Cellulomonas sp. Leaf334]|uniref:hypothetical protein n=1 Tax=Cellulomonas sp. Leaf334 TaxID=1736339 RepID=UPI0006FB042C|nr:hypothetical protein [Cellulomonas sp. Leaf334]KQR17316.1 hypothetical protein ASF78_08500 [Cellulomonas sp. Leaf334]
MSARRTVPVLAVAVLVLAGCTQPADPPECVGDVVEGAERVAVMVPTPLSGGGRAVVAEVDMAASPPTADLSVTAPSRDGLLRVDASVGSVFDAEGVEYEVVRVCESGLDVVPQS